jgi:hypothetical protein
MGLLELLYDYVERSCRRIVSEEMESGMRTSKMVILHSGLELLIIL